MINYNRTINTLKEISSTLDKAINLTPTGETRNLLCDLNIIVKSELFQNELIECSFGELEIGAKFSENSTNSIFFNIKTSFENNGNSIDLNNGRIRSFRKGEKVYRIPIVVPPTEESPITMELLCKLLCKQLYENRIKKVMEGKSPNNRKMSENEAIEQIKL